MHQVHLQLNDQLFAQAKRRAVESGFNSVDEYIADVVAEDLAHDGENLDHLFSAERLVAIDKAKAQIEAGQFLSAKDAEAELARRRTEWQESHRA